MDHLSPLLSWGHPTQIQPDTLDEAEHFPDIPRELALKHLSMNPHFPLSTPVVYGSWHAGVHASGGWCRRRPSQSVPPRARERHVHLHRIQA